MILSGLTEVRLRRATLRALVGFGPLTERISAKGIQSAPGVSDWLDMFSSRI